MDGLETLRQLKQRIPDVPVVMLSGHGQARTIVEAMRLGASDFLRKPFEVEELELAFQKALENRALKQRGRSGCAAARAPRHELLLLGGDNPQDEGGARDHRAGRRHRHHGARARRERNRQGARRPHASTSSRAARDQPFVKVNCAALPSELLESELFGFEKGAFTGAQKRKLGKFEYANKGTIFLDEIGEMQPGPAGQAAPGAPGRRVLAPRRRERRARSTRGSSPRRTATSRRRSRTGASARTSTTG